MGDVSELKVSYAGQSSDDRFKPGVVPASSRGFEFRVLAPVATSVALWMFDEATGFVTQQEMQESGKGCFTCSCPQARVGMRYGYRLDGGRWFPDPWSRYQPNGIHAPSQIVDQASYNWQNIDWIGRPAHESVIYELHVGAFTPQGTYRAAMEKLPFLADLGITAVLLMPLSEASDGPGWGYDGVSLFAAKHQYGSPDELKSFIDAAHRLGIQMILDVVFNHLGPEGNYLGHMVPQMFSQHHLTPWGPGFNFEGPDGQFARDAIIDCAIFWLDEFHFDGLRLDAPEMMHDSSTVHILRDLSQAVGDRFGANRFIHLFLENDHEAARHPREVAQCHFKGFFNLQGMEILSGMMARLDNADPQQSSQALEQLGFAICQTTGVQEHGVAVGKAPTGVPTHQRHTLLGLQNHDVIGNSATGNRLVQKIGPADFELLLSLVMLSPQLPYIFMGDEWGCEQPFPFFCQYRDIDEADIRHGRAREFGLDPDDQLSPYDPDTFRQAVLDWPDAGNLARNRTAQLVRQLLAVRQKTIIPMLSAGPMHTADYTVSGRSLIATWVAADRQKLVLEVFPADRRPARSSGEVVFEHIQNAEVNFAGNWSMRAVWSQSSAGNKCRAA